MRSSHTLDRLETRFDDDRLVADAGLLLPATLAHHLDLGAAVGRANAGDKLLTLVMSALAGGDCIDDAVRHEAPRDRVGGRSPPPICRSRSAKLGAA
ncbi:hypothetical protein BH20ACT3_BH20ACT3_08330 [soil metagenome]